MNTLLNFDFISYLKKHNMVGQVDPWRRTVEDKPIYTLLVSVDTAYEGCKLWSNQEFTKTEFTNYLKLNDIYLFKNVENFVEIREETRKNTGKRNVSEEERNKRRNRMVNINKSKKIPSLVNT